METKPRILIVDDEVPVCKSLCGILDDQKYEVDMALSGEEALEKETQNKYNVVITDLMMPGMSGMNLLQILRVKRPELPIIIITGYPSIRTAVNAIKLGAFDFIPKPFTPNELRGLVWRALERQMLFTRLKEKSKDRGKFYHGRQPKGLYCISEHSWAKVEQQNVVRVGVHHVFLMTIKQVVRVELPELHDLVNQGEVCAKIRGIDLDVSRVWSPVSGKVIEINEILKEDCKSLLSDPYGDGWLMKISSSQLQEDLKNLTTS